MGGGGGYSCHAALDRSLSYNIINSGHGNSRLGGGGSNAVVGVGRQRPVSARPRGLVGPSLHARAPAQVRREHQEKVYLQHTGYAIKWFQLTKNYRLRQKKTSLIAIAAVNKTR